MYVLKIFPCVLRDLLTVMSPKKCKTRKKFSPDHLRENLEGILEKLIRNVLRMVLDLLIRLLL
jgi:hypothetical protein